MSTTYIFCRKCESEYSTTRGDYWDAALDTPFRCCNVNSYLIQRGGRFSADKVLAYRVVVGDLT